MAEIYHGFCSFEAHKNIAFLAGTSFILLVVIECVREKCEGERRTPPLVPACTIWNLTGTCDKLKSSYVSVRTIKKLNPCGVDPGFKPRPHWLKVTDLTLHAGLEIVTNTAPVQLIFSPW